MIYKYRYLQKRYSVLSFLLVLLSLAVASIGVWVGVIAYLYNHEPISGTRVFMTIAIVFFSMGPMLYLNEKIIKTKCTWDQISISERGIFSLRYGDIVLKNIRSIKVKDLSNVYGFVLSTDNKRFDFSCLSFLGREGGNEYTDDKEALKSLAAELTRFANLPDYHISVEKESSSNIIFILACIAMVMLIPGFIYAPQRMIFVAPFVIPLFFVLWKKRQGDRVKTRKSTKKN